MTNEDWMRPAARTIGMYLDGRGIRPRGRRGARVVGESFLLVLHADSASLCFTLPKTTWAEGYEVVLDTTHERGEPPEPLRLPGGAELHVHPRSVQLLRVTH